jgi:hypothetical protein
MPKSTQPLVDQLTPTNPAAGGASNMPSSTTDAADKLGANKGTNAIPQGVRLAPLSTSHFTLHTSHFALRTSHFALHTSHFSLFSFLVQIADESRCRTLLSFRLLVPLGNSSTRMVRLGRLDRRLGDRLVRRVSWVVSLMRVRMGSRDMWSVRWMGRAILREVRLR